MFLWLLFMLFMLEVHVLNLSLVDIFRISIIIVSLVSNVIIPMCYSIIGCYNVEKIHVQVLIYSLLIISEYPCIIVSLVDNNIDAISNPFDFLGFRLSMKLNIIQNKFGICMRSYFFSFF